MQYSLEQQRIIKHTIGVGLIDAGPGTGKSSTLIGTVSHRLQHGIKANEIILLTYNKSTQLDVELRIRLQLGAIANDVSVSTIHAFGLSVIKQHYMKLGFTAEPQHQQSASTDAKKSKQQARSRLRRNIVNYNDMISMCLQLFTQHTAVLTKVASRYQFMLIDELQDVDKEQAKLIMMLAKSIKASLLVGDKKQLIYGFRGAGIALWNNMIKKLSPKQYSLTQTFRIPKAALPFVNAVAAEFSNDRPLVSDVKGKKPSLHRFNNTDEQADFIANEVNTLIQKGIAYTDIACLATQNVPLLQLKLALAARGIPAVETYDCTLIDKWSSHLRALIYITRWSIDQHKHTPIKGINKLFKLVSIPKDQRETLFNNIVDAGIEALTVKRVDCKSDQHYRRLLNVRKAIIAAAQQSDALAGIQLLIDALLPYAKNADKRHWKYIQRELSQLKLSARDLSWQQVYVKSLNHSVDDTGITLTTIHGAKGKEWRYVFLINTVEQEFHITEDAMKDTSVQALLYTAITRHSRKLYILETAFDHVRFTKQGKMVRQHHMSECQLITNNLQYLNDCRD